MAHTMTTRPLLPHGCVALLCATLMVMAACNKTVEKEDTQPSEQEAVATAAITQPASQPASQPAASAEAAEELATPEEQEAPKPPTIDHAAFDRLLNAYVSSDTGMVDYEGLKTKESELDQYLEQTIAPADLSNLSESETFAYYVNAYNAYTLKLILENYPGIKSIKKLKKPWKTERWEVAKETLSLDQIEHEKLRPVYKDPRIHFAVNCASIGCPPLRAEAYTGAQLEEQLEAATRATLQQDKYVEAKKGKLYLSSLLDWYGTDFTNPEYKGHEESVAQYVAKYAGEDVVELVEEKGKGTQVKFKEYDWSLNAQAK